MTPTAVWDAPTNALQATADNAIETRGLTKRFGRETALAGVDLAVPRGAVYALLGRNGAGKSTLMQLLMGGLDATSGAAEVLGLSPALDPVPLKDLVGYIPDHLPMYDWMTVGEMLRFCAELYRRWSRDDEAGLVAQFRLHRDQRVGALSRGNRALLSLVVAMAHRPQVVLLDECTSGMDAVARRRFERSVIDALQLSGRTVLFAGHQIDEMERICDWVGVLRDGRMLLQMPIDDLKARVRLLRMRADSGAEQIPGCTVLQSRVAGQERLVTVRIDDPGRAAAIHSGNQIVTEEMGLSLEEIFVNIVGEEDGT